ncbi:unnamed protein product [Rotaria sp. Silwood2]|nr:unnamed protein product [Rotaria sp. Silwood2]CAF2671828.1 unnamed protein product [Rotaria sp. Silwood2]CAF4529874.1 unnamed protein product [Rotaria sp. Silwood2]
MISVYIVQFSEDHALSVMICVEDGWDIAAQFISISELLLDPYYRIFEGFHRLIEHEWFEIWTSIFTSIKSNSYK